MSPDDETLNDDTETDGQSASAKNDNDLARNTVINVAAAEVGAGVHAKTAGDTDDAGRTRRQGYERLLEYFHVAAPGLWPDDLITYLQPNLPSWCGIFALWALKTANILDNGSMWKKGSGISVVKGLTPTKTPNVGDIGYIDQPFQHHCIVKEISADGGTITTIDGNSGADGTVAINSRPRSGFFAFYTAF